MLCSVALRRTHAQDGAESYTLRISGKTALGPSGTGGRDTREGLSAAEVHTTLANLGLSENAAAAALAVMHDPQSTDRFTPIAEDVQIPFDILERADIYLFD